MAKSRDWTEILVRRGVIGPDQLKEASGSQSGTVEDALIRLGYATSEEVMRAVAQQYGYDYVDLNEVSIPPSVIELVPESVARENAILPMDERDGSLKVIISDPEDFETLDKLRFILNRRVEVALAPRESIVDAINRHYGLTEGESADSMLQEFTDTAIDFTETEETAATADEQVDETSAPIVRLVHLIITEAVQLRASDIHVEPFEDRVRIRYRIDGILQERDSPPRRLLGAILSRIKILSKIDIAERRRPQDGRIKATVGDKELDFRVSVMPSVFGEDAVLRILDRRALSDQLKGLTLDSLGFDEDIIERMRKLSAEPYGMLLVTGPTGSGKTTSLYAAITEVNKGLDKIITIEDPVEYQLPGVLQIPVNEQKGLTFARGLRSILRHDPDRIMVGEIRDPETAEIAVQSALTGHLVYTTVHANNAFDVLGRFTHMGVDPYNLVSALNAVLAQRLVRVFCTVCKGRGCAQCRGTGFKGRKAIGELLVLNDELRELIIARAPARKLKEVARAAGTTPLREAAMRLVNNGETSLEEINRVTFVA